MTALAKVATNVAVPAPASTPTSAADHLGLADCRILVVDDQEWSRAILEGYLRAAGFNNLDFACDGVEAIQRIDRAMPDLVVLDIVMPELDGYAVCEHLRGNERMSDLPILVQTVLDEPTQRFKAFEKGATDLVNKPVNRQELLARVAVHLQNRMMIRDLRDYRQRVTSELSLARNMQLSLLPKPDQIQAIETSHGISLASAFQPSTELGGDIWGIRPLDTGGLAIFTCDVAGHGVGAALNTFRIHALMQTLLRPDDPASALDELNSRLSGVLPPGLFATMFYGVLETSVDRVVYASAACPAPLVHGPNTLVAGNGTGFPLGIYGGARYENRILDFPKGSALFLHSDALIEAQSSDGTMLEDAGVAALVGRIPSGSPAPRYIDTIASAFTDHLDGRSLPDDLTLVCLAR